MGFPPFLSLLHIIPPKCFKLPCELDFMYIIIKYLDKVNGNTVKEDDVKARPEKPSKQMLAEFRALTNKLLNVTRTTI